MYSCDARRRWAAVGSRRGAGPRRGGRASRAGVEAGLPVEDDGVVGWPITTASPATAPELEQLVLDAEPVEPVGEEADGLVVAEVGLPHPALGLRAADALAGSGRSDLDA